MVKEDLGGLLLQDGIEARNAKVEAIYKAQQTNNKNIIWAIVKAFKFRFMLGFFFNFLDHMTHMALPVIVRELTEYI